MSRFLSPAKVCLVILIDVYYHGEVLPGDTIKLLSFISNRVIQRKHRDTVQAIDDVSQLRLGDIDVFKAALSQLGSRLPGRPLYDVFLKYLWRLASFEQLDELFDKNRSINPEGESGYQPIAPTSPLGQYLRRCQLEFVRLQFSDCQQLWEDFNIFRQSSWSAWAVRNPEEAANFHKLSGGSEDYISPILLDRQDKRAHDGYESLPSQDVLDRTVQFQLEQIQSTGCRLSAEMQQELASMIQYASIRPADIHFVKFFDSWRAGAYSEAIENLHRYFDYAMEGYGGQQNIKAYHQYALLHLAVLHADFGCYEEAIAAMDECIATARENQDTRCLNFGLSWLVHLRKAHPEYLKHERLLQVATIASSEAEILPYLQQKALENKDWTQLSSALLSQAESTVSNGTGIARAFDYSYQSNHLNLKYAIQGLQSNQVRLHGSLFAQIGAHSLADMQATVFKTVYSGAATRPETLSMACVQAYQMAMRGEYKAAMQTLIENDPSKHRTLRMHNLHLGIANMVKLRQTLHHNELFTAGRLLQKVTFLRTMAEPDIAFETEMLELEYLRKSSRITEALDKISAMMSDGGSEVQIGQSHRIRLLVMKASLWASDGKPTKGFTVALRAANAAYTRMLQPLMWSAVAALAEILNDLEEYEGARHLLDSIIPRAVEGGDVYLVGRLYSLLTDAFVGQACKAFEKGSKQRDQHLNSAKEYLERAKEALDKVEDLDGTLACLEKKSMLFRCRGEVALAEEMDRMHDAEVKRALAREREAKGYVDE